MLGGIRSIASFPGCLSATEHSELVSTLSSILRVQHGSQGVFAEDPDLCSYEGHLRYRWNQFQRTLGRIQREEGGLLHFARGFERLGLHNEGPCMVYREWAPAAMDAQMIGEFNSWNGTQMQRDEHGVWSCTLPNMDGALAVKHMTKYKIRLKHRGGWWVDVLPAWTTYAIQDHSKMGGAFDAVYWNPPQKHTWRHFSPPRPRALCIYEAHVGMSSEDPKVASYRYFADEVLPHIVHQGYNTVQLMAIQEHPYYGSCGYHVSNLFAVSSRCGTPEDLKYLIDTAHGQGLFVVLDVVHSHMTTNTVDGLAGFDMGQSEQLNYFKQGPRGYHTIWDSRLFNYNNWEVLRLLLSNLLWWMKEYRFDGFRFDGVTSMLYHHHGINYSFSGHYGEYFSTATDVDAAVYLMLANKLIHMVAPHAVTLAEDVSGMPTLCSPVEKGGVGFDYRMAMGIPELWIQTVKHYEDGEWSLESIVAALQDRRRTEKTIAYVECHDQSIVGGKTLAFRLIGPEMWTNMSALYPMSANIRRGLALHKMIRLLTLALGGDGWLNFMGNEFGHPDWVDFPRVENGWSHDRCRRLWSLIQKSHLRYKSLSQWDKAMMQLEHDYSFLAASHSISCSIMQPHRCIVVERGPLLFLFNFSPNEDCRGLSVGVSFSRSYHCVLDSDAAQFDGEAKSGPRHETHSPVPARDNKRGYQLTVSLSARSCMSNNPPYMTVMSILSHVLPVDTPPCKTRIYEL